MEAAGSSVGLAPYIIVVNALLVGVVLVVAGRLLARGKLTPGVPTRRQAVGEFATGFFLDKAREMAHGSSAARVVRVVAPLLGTFFMFILASNLVGILPIPIVNRPPTSYFGATLALALCSVVLTLILGVMFRGVRGALVHLFWPNPLQLVSEFTDVLSLSLRLFGNMGGEYLTFTLVALYVPYGLPLILHVLGLLPVFVQALVFTLLTASFIAAAISHAEPEDAEAAAKAHGSVQAVAVQPAAGPGTRTPPSRASA